MMIHVDREHVESLISHLAAQGFPASRVGEDGLDVLFPASPPLLATAAQLADWEARTGATAALRFDGKGTRPRPARAPSSR
jgi:hypothetical protein